MAYTGKKPIDVIDATTAQTLTIEDNIVTPSINNGQIGGRRNLIINGAMQVAQRGTSGSLPSTNNYLVDRFHASRLGGLADIFDTSQVSDAPTGFQKSLKLTQDGTSVTLSGTHASMVGYRPEGQDFSHLQWGTSNAKKITVSFYVKSSVTGTFAFTIASSNSDQDIAKEYTISTANTWEYKTFTIPGPTSGTWGTGTSIFGYFTWGIAGVLGSARETSNIDIWGSGSGGASVTVTANSTNAVATTSGATWQITGVQLEVGSVATEFEHRSFGEELALCQRYFQTFSAAVGRTSTGTPFGAFDIRPNMRAQPSATRLGNAVSVDETGTTVTPDFANASALATDAIQRVFYFNDTDTSGDQGAGGVGTLDAEL